MSPLHVERIRKPDLRTRPTGLDVRFSVRQCGSGKASRLIILAIFLFLSVGERSWAQFRVPIIPRIPVPVPMPFHVPLPGHGTDSNPGPADPNAHPGWSLVNPDMCALLVFFALYVGLIVAALSPLWKGLRRSLRIRIIAVPPGEAPQSVRQSWVGLELPLAPGQRGSPRMLAAEGVLSDHPGGTVLGYVVEGKTAIRALELHDAAAAAWWRENVPEVMSSQYQLGFPAEVCQRVFETNRGASEA